MSSDGDFGGTAECPSVPWRLLSSTTMLGVGALCRAFLLGVSRPEINGLGSFLEILESRQDPSQRSKGLLTGRWYTWLDDPLVPGTNWLIVTLFLDSFEPYQRVRTWKGSLGGRGGPSHEFRVEKETDPCSMDDPIMWGALPMRHHMKYPVVNMRWSFGSHDICFQNRYNELLPPFLFLRVGVWLMISIRDV